MRPVEATWGYRSGRRGGGRPTRRARRVGSKRNPAGFGFSRPILRSPYAPMHAVHAVNAPAQSGLVRLDMRDYLTAPKVLGKYRCPTRAPDANLLNCVAHRPSPGGGTFRPFRLCRPEGEVRAVVEGCPRVQRVRTRLRGRWCFSAEHSRQRSPGGCRDAGVASVLRLRTRPFRRRTRTLLLQPSPSAARVLILELEQREGSHR